MPFATGVLIGAIAGIEGIEGQFARAKLDGYLSSIYGRDECEYCKTVHAETRCPSCGAPNRYATTQPKEIRK